jgi:hypothetical protein
MMNYQTSVEAKLFPAAVGFGQVLNQISNII